MNVISVCEKFTKGSHIRICNLSHIFEKILKHNRRIIMKQNLNRTALVIIILASLMIGQPVSAYSQYSIVDLGMPGPFGGGIALNDKGQIVGQSGGEESQFAFLWQDGVMTRLEGLGGSFNIAFAINNQGQIIGNSGTASGETHAV